MVHDTEQLLAQKHHDDDVDVGRCDQIKDAEVHKCKKHGILCRILTALHLKKRRKKYQEHQKLLSESQEQLARSTSKKKRKKSKASATTEVDSKPTKVITLPKVGSNRSNNNNVNKFATTYEKLDNISINSDDLVPVDLEFWDMESPSEEPQLPHEILQSAHMYGDDRFGECQIDRAQNKYARLSENEQSESLSAGEYLKHQWKGKRAKKARKGIRTVMKATWRSLQNGVGSQVTFVSPQGAITSAIVSSRNRRS